MAACSRASVFALTLLFGVALITSCSPGDSEEASSRDSEAWDGDVADDIRSRAAG